MYEKLVEELRNSAPSRRLMLTAADAIEELQRDKDALAEEVARWQSETVRSNCDAWLSENVVNDAHNEGYDVGYWAGRRDYEPKWIPVTERLPEAYTAERNSAAGVPTRALTYSEEGGCEVGAYTQFGWMFPCYMPKPTHWMPLPEPPKEET